MTWEQSIGLTQDELDQALAYIRDPRPLEGVDTRINPDAPPAPGQDPLVTDEVNFDT